MVSGSFSALAVRRTCATAEIEMLEEARFEARVTERAIVRAGGQSTVRLTGSPEVDSTVTDEVTLEVTD